MTEFYNTRDALVAAGVKIEPVSRLTLRNIELEAYAKLIGAYGSIDAMDALHIIVAATLNTTRFVSFDKGWQQVKGIHVYA
jgi:predicted nucleic acid-binding protein